MTGPIARGIAPDSVRVWRGFRLATLPLAEFHQRLGSVFIPATVEMQTRAGLKSYAPSVTGGMAGKPAYVPDETAILFWGTQDTYRDGFNRLAVRTYTLTHNGVYVTEQNRSRADFPVQFSGKLQVDQPVFLFDQPADWMHGSVRHFVGGRHPDTPLPEFVASVEQALAAIQHRRGLAGAIACIGSDYVLYWQLERNGNAKPAGMSELEQLPLAWSTKLEAAPTQIPAGMWEVWPGLAVEAGNSFNMQFPRRKVP